MSKRPLNSNQVRAIAPDHTEKSNSTEGKGGQSEENDRGKLADRTETTARVRPRGVRKFRTIEEANADRDKWDKQRARCVPQPESGGCES